MQLWPGQAKSARTDASTNKEPKTIKAMSSLSQASLSKKTSLMFV